MTELIRKKIIVKTVIFKLVKKIISNSKLAIITDNIDELFLITFLVKNGVRSEWT